jgi:hypothetical protein
MEPDPKAKFLPHLNFILSLFLIIQPFSPTFEAILLPNFGFTF